MLCRLLFWCCYLQKSLDCCSYTSMMIRWKVTITEVDGDGWLGFFIRAGRCIWDGKWHNVMEIFKLLISGSFEVSNHGIRFVILVRTTVTNWMFLRKWSAETWQPWFGLTGSCTSYFGSVAWCTFEDAGPFQGWTSEWWTWSSWMIFFGQWTFHWIDKVIMIFWCYYWALRILKSCRTIVDDVLEIYRFSL